MPRDRITLTGSGNGNNAGINRPTLLSEGWNETVYVDDSGLQMFRLVETVTLEATIKKSRFVGSAFPVTEEAAVKKTIAENASTTANHNCWAWRIGRDYRFSDDGEPTGTAGKPILAAIDGRSLDNVVVIVTRWFGGVLLGTGGLVRAYGGTAAACLNTATLVPLVTMVEGKLDLRLSDLAMVKARLSSFGGVRIVSQHFDGTSAEMSLQIPESDLEAISALIGDLTRGRSKLEL